MTLEEMNKRLKKSHICSYPIIPKAEGFCFCIRREVINNIKYLDEIFGDVI
jgi:GT2 family glycosyltransferase